MTYASSTYVYTYITVKYICSTVLFWDCLLRVSRNNNVQERCMRTYIISTGVSYTNIVYTWPVRVLHKVNTYKLVSSTMYVMLYHHSSITWNVMLRGVVYTVYYVMWLRVCPYSGQRNIRTQYLSRLVIVHVIVHNSKS
jgi:hypothetical protein